VKIALGESDHFPVGRNLPAPQASLHVSRQPPICRPAKRINGSCNAFHDLDLIFEISNCQKSPHLRPLALREGGTIPSGE
jgi:hypothetical protein